MKKRLLHRLRGSGFGAQALAVAALLLTSAASQAQTTAYCNTGLGGTCGGNDITAVGISGTTLNATGLTCTSASSQAYTSYPATGTTTATLSGGVPYTLSTTLSGQSIVSVWIDYNHNFVFDASEWTQVTTSSPTGTPVSVQLLVPSNAVQGQTGMRIRSRTSGSANGAADACTQFFSGETKDFTVTIGAPASCPAVSGLSVAGITGSNATVSFTPASGATNYTVTATPTTGTPVTQTATGSPVTLTGLTASTNYTLNVVTNCGGTSGSSAAASISFTTACSTAPYVLVNSSTPYTQDFEAAWLSQCGTNEIPGVNWRNTPVTGNNSWRRDDDGASASWTGPTSGAYTPTGSTLGGATGTHSARFHTYNATSGSVGLLDLYVNLASTNGTPVLTFDHINTTGTDSLKVFVSTNGGASFTLVPGAAFTTAATWTRRQVVLPSGLTATTVIRLRARSDFGTTDIGVDNVAVNYLACPPVTAASISGISATGATINFTATAGAGSYTVTVTPANGTASTVTPAPTGSPVVLTGLTASTAYTVSIVGNCGTNSSTATTLTFTTACTAAPYILVNNTTPYSQDFEAAWLSQCGTNDVPTANWRNTPVTGNNSWRRDDDGASASWTGPTSGAYTPTGSTLGGATGTHSARFHTYNATSGSVGLLDLYVNMAGTQGTPTLFFDHINTSGTDSLKVFVSTNGGTSFTLVPGAAFTTASTWTRRSIALPSGLTATTVIRLRARSDFGTTDIGVDNVAVNYVTCPPVTAASISNITTTSASLNFTPGAGSGSYTVTVTPAGGTASTVTPAPTGSPVALTGLTASTAYTVSIVGNCGASSSSVVTLTFNTACTAAPYATVNNTTAYTQDFEATWLSQCGTKEVPGVNWRNTPTTGNTSWRRDDDGASANWTSTSGAYTPTGSPLGGATGTHSARFHSYDATSGTTGLFDLYVNMAGTQGTPTLSFDYINTSGTDSLAVRISTDGGTTFGRSVLKLTTASTWTAQTVNLPTTGLTATTIIRFAATGDFGFTDIGLDNVRVSYITCPAVTGVSVSNITTNAASVDFTASPSGGSYVVTVTPAGGTATTQTVTTTPVNLTGLTPSTLYTVSIVANCGAANGNSTPVVVTFRTDCVAAPYVLVNNATPYTQDFEATWLSQCDTREVPGVNWRNTPTTGNTSWRRDDDGASANWTSTSGAYTPTGSPLGGATGTHSARFHSYDATSGTTGLFDLYVNMAGTQGTPTLSFDYINTSGTDSLAVRISTDGGTTFGRTLLKLTTASTWTRQSLALPTTGLTATTVIRLTATGDFGTTDIGVDNLRLGYVTCPAVTALTVTNVTATTATVSFTASPSGGSYVITATPATGTPITQTVTASPVTLTGLTANTAYTVSVVANCGAANGNSTAVVASITTDCAQAPYVLVNNATPYTQDFETAWLSQCGTNEIPGVNWRNTPVTGNNSWRRDDDGASASWTGPTSGAYTPTGSTLGGATGTHSARFHTYNATRGTSGQLDLYVNLAGTGAAAGLSFDYLNTTGTDSLAVMVSTNGGTSFGRSILKLTTAATWTRQTLTLPAAAGATTIIRFMATSDFGTTDIGLDNVRVTYSACLPVSNLTATNVTSNGAQLGFTPPAGAPTGTTYEIEYGLQGFTLGSGTKVTGLTAPTYTLTGLTQSTDYCFYVRQNCGTANGSSSYAGPVCFSTPLPTLTNDDPCGAIALGNTVTTGTNLGATTSAQNGLVLPTCSGAQLPKDVWFSFTATAASMPMTVTGTAAGVVQVYTSPDCSAGPFTRVFCQAGPNNNQNVGPLTITGLTRGTRYYLSVSGYGSGDTQGTFTIGALPTATKAQADTDALLVYPNPSNTGQLTLRLSGQTGNGQATLLNALGQVVATKNLSGTTEQTLSTRGLATGLYTLRVTVAGQVLTRKVVLE